MDSFDMFGMDVFGDSSDPVPDYTSVADYASQAASANNALFGDGNSPPVVSDNTNQAAPSILQLLGGAANTARDVGTAVGTIQRQIQGVGPAYQAGYNASSTGNSLSTWWQYASTTDKLMVGLAVVGIIVAVKS